MSFEPSRPDAPADAQGVYLAQLANGPQPQRGRAWAAWILIFFLLAMVLVPIVAYWLPTELDKWRLAAAEEKWLNGDLPGAIDSLTESLQRDADNVDLYLRRAEFYIENEDYEAAIADCTQALAKSPTTQQLYQAYVNRATARQHLGEHAAAIEDFKELVKRGKELGISRRIEVQNGLAYARALGKSELEDALKLIEEAIRLKGEEAYMLDTRGFLHYLLGHHEQARADLDRAVSGMEDLATQVTEARSLMDKREYAKQRKLVDKNVAVLHYHRALVLQALNDTAGAEKDLQRVRDLGFEPTEKLF